jgi:hypothetical protein
VPPALFQSAQRTTEQSRQREVPATKACCS